MLDMMVTRVPSILKSLVTASAMCLYKFMPPCDLVVFLHVAAKQPLTGLLVDSAIKSAMKNWVQPMMHGLTELAPDSSQASVSAGAIATVC